jgi:hypothetical protein
MKQMELRHSYKKSLFQRHHTVKLILDLPVQARLCCSSETNCGLGSTCELLKFTRMYSQLRVIGQCAGVGIVSVLFLLLRQSFSKLRCGLVFSPPGCVFSSSMDYSEWVSWYVLYSDSYILPPRLFGDSLDAFQKELLEMFCFASSIRF